MKVRFFMARMMPRLSRLLLVHCLNAIIVVSLAVSSLSYVAWCGDILPEDLNGDGKVDIDDVLILAAAYGSYPGHTCWNPSADIIDDEQIDIFDAVAVIAKLGVNVSPPQISATVRFLPKTLNLKSEGRWITAYIELPEGRNLRDIDIRTVMLNNTVPVDLTWSIEVGDYDNDNISDLMLVFNRTEVVEYVLSKGLAYGDVTLALTGDFRKIGSFEGSDVVTVSGLVGDVNCDGTVSLDDIISAAASYHCSQDEACWNSNANFAPPWNVIDILDLVTIAYHYGETYA